MLTTHAANRRRVVAMTAGVLGLAALAVAASCTSTPAPVGLAEGCSILRGEPRLRLRALPRRVRDVEGLQWRRQLCSSRRVPASVRDDVHADAALRDGAHVRQRQVPRLVQDGWRLHRRPLRRRPDVYDPERAAGLPHDRCRVRQRRARRRAPGRCPRSRRELARQDRAHGGLSRLGEGLESPDGHRAPGCRSRHSARVCTSPSWLWSIWLRAIELRSAPALRPGRRLDSGRCAV
jgi:hypothetical protein